MNSYWKKLVNDLQSRKRADKIVEDRKVVFVHRLYDQGRVFGTHIAVYEKPTPDSDWRKLYVDELTLQPRGEYKYDFVVLDSILKYVPRDVLRAIVKHEDVHIKYGLSDHNTDDKERDQDMRLAVDVIAFMETRNPFCVAFPSGLKEYLIDYLKS